MLAGIGTATANLSTLLSEFQWWFVVMGVAAVVIGTAAVIRHVARSRWWATVGAVVASVVVVTVFFEPESAVLGIIPTPNTLAAFRALEELGRDSIASQSIPADASRGIVYLVSVGVAAIAVVIDLLAQQLRAPAVAGVPLLVLLLVPTFVQTELSDPFLFALTAAVYLGMLVLGSNPVGRRTALAIGATALVGALFVPVLLPQVNPAATATGSSSGLSAGINPIVTLGNDLRRGSPTLALTYTTTESRGTYLRLTALDDFRGVSWEPTAADVIEGNDVQAIGAAPGVGAGVPTRAVTTEVTVGSILSRWLPLPYAPVSVTGLTGEWSWEPDGLAVRTQSSNARNQKYTVESTLIAPSVEQLRAAGTTVDAGLERYLDVPADLPAVVGATAREVVGTAATNYEKALALQNYFRGRDFTYSEVAPVDQDYDGSGASVLAQFLEVKAGYCVHFSSAMAAMARTLGIPARVAVGFTPGDAVQTGDVAEYRVTTYDFHAWPELYFAGIGWVRFEPTPGRGVLPEFAPLTADDPNTPDVDESVPPVPTPAPTAASTGAPTIPNDVLDPTATAPDATTTAPNLGWVFGALAVLLVLTPWALRGLRRNRRLAAVDRGSALDAWREVRDTAHDLGLAPNDAWTPRQLALELAPRLDDRGGAALARLRAAVEHESFARGLANAEVSDVKAVSQSLRRNRGLAWRILAAIVPRSLVGAWLPRPAR